MSGEYNTANPLGCPQPVNTREIQRHMAMLRESVQILESSFSGMSDRLKPILNEMPMTEGEEKTKNKLNCTTPLSTDISTIDSRIWVIIDAVNALMVKMEI